MSEGAPPAYPEIPTEPAWDVIGRSSSGEVRWFQRFKNPKEAHARLEMIAVSLPEFTFTLQESLAMLPDRRLPSQDQLRSLCDLMHRAFVAIRMMGYRGETEAMRDLADALHRLPREVFDPDRWDWHLARAELAEFERKHPGKSSFALEKTLVEIHQAEG